MEVEVVTAGISTDREGRSYREGTSEDESDIGNGVGSGPKGRVPGLISWGFSPTLPPKSRIQSSAAGWFVRAHGVSRRVCAEPSATAWSLKGRAKVLPPYQNGHWSLYHELSGLPAWPKTMFSVD